MDNETVTIVKEHFEKLIEKEKLTFSCDAEKDMLFDMYALGWLDHKRWYTIRYCDDGK